MSKPTLKPRLSSVMKENRINSAASLKLNPKLKSDLIHKSMDYRAPEAEEVKKIYTKLKQKSSQLNSLLH